MRRAEGGLTLLEVMAAVAILGLVYTLLAQAATRGIRSEAENRLRLEASLLADARIAEIESQLLAGVAPVVEGALESEREGFTVTEQVTAFELPVELATDAPPRPPGAPDLFAPDPRATPVLLRVDLTVAWEGGAVSRVTFAFDRAAAEAATGGVTPAPTPEEAS